MHRSLQICSYIVTGRILCLISTNLKKLDLVDKFNDTSRHLDDKLTIDYPEFEQHISDIYPAELQLTKGNVCDEETSFLDLNITVVDDDIHTSVYDKRDDFVNFPWLSGDVPRLSSYGIYISFC